jgi:hypothetical protein
VTGQTYANHAYRARAWTAALLGSVVASGLLISSAFAAPSQLTLALVVLSLTVAFGLWVMRQFALRLQDRIILLEMQVRLTRLGRPHDVARLGRRQLIALRFASDAELPALADRATAEQLTPDQIKKAVVNWQGDYLRT